MRRTVALLLLTLLASTSVTGCVEAGSDPAPATRNGASDASARAAGEGVAPAVELRLLDVGQGDAVLIRSWEESGESAFVERVALIDAGPANRIVGRLRALGVQHIDLLVASHNHADHIGGMDAILDSLPVRFYLDNGHPATTRIQQRVLERVEERGVTYLEPTRRTLSLGTARLRVIPPPPGVPGDEQNNRSLTLILEQGSFRAIFPGDAETQLLNALLATEELPTVDVLKASHHGSRNGVTPAWMARLRPAMVAISVAEGNSYGHPHAAALRYYCTGDRRVLRTDQHGDVVVAIGAEGEYEVRTTRGTELPMQQEREFACGTHSAVDTPSAAAPGAGTAGGTR
jgi:competence protein ComEC